MQRALVVFLAAVVGVTFALPIGNDIAANVTTTTAASSSKFIIAGAACNTMDEIRSDDPCKPLCACKEGRIFCADIICSTDTLPMEECYKLPLNGKCCPSYLCTAGNGTGDVHYPLPILVVPPELNLASIPNSKSNMLHRLN
ncbi:uncharacterized protein LOC129593391 isoform X2 [Paramacrobiotus metropolitanus]|nr:uncharacterized protein LOC129593391 isoform X2 [Paramacrobiotus metropolitanus]